MSTLNWLRATRPVTLVAAFSPVCLGFCLAQHDLRLSLIVLAPFWQLKLLCCFAFAACMQIVSNFINDLIDFRRGSDGAQRLGPPRACAQGWISPRAMRRGISLTLILAIGIGLLLTTLVIVHPHWWHNPSWTSFETAIDHTTLCALLVVGLCCVAAAYLYSSHLSRWALGDVLVLLFFGAVPTAGTYFVLTNCDMWQVLRAAFWGFCTVGIVIDGLLLINNIRDFAEDQKTGKHTLIVWLGQAMGKKLYALTAFLALLLPLSQLGFAALPLFLPYLLLHSYVAFRLLPRLHGAALNRLLLFTAILILIYTTALCLSLLA